MKFQILRFILCCDNPDIFRKNKAIDPLDGLPQQGVLAHDLEHLLRAGFPAQGPEPGPRAASKDNGMNVIK